MKKNFFIIFFSLPLFLFIHAVTAESGFSASGAMNTVVDNSLSGSTQQTGQTTQNTTGSESKGQFFLPPKRLENFNSMELPLLTQPVTDFAGVLTSDQLSNLVRIASTYEVKTSTQIVTVIIPDRQDKVLFDIALKIFRDNKLGKKEKNNGVLLVIAADEKKIRIVVGYGLEGVLPDLTASDIIENNIRPFVNSGDFNTAINNFYVRVTGILDGSEPVPEKIVSKKTGGENFWLLPIGIALGMIVVFIGISLIDPKKKTLLGMKPIVPGLFSFGGGVGLMLMAGLLTMGVGYLFGYVFALILKAFGSSSGGSGGGSHSSGSSGYDYTSSSDSSSSSSWSSSDSDSSSSWSGGGGSSGGGGAGD